MTPAQSRAARALLAITQSELALMANLGLSTVVDFERERREVSEEAIRAMQGAFEARGIQFLDENEAGEGVRFRDPKRRVKKRPSAKP
jgi:transcriptional regulator with XRE-family HTH domain